MCRSRVLGMLFAGLVLIPAAGCSHGEDPVLQASSDVERCQEQLRRIYEGLRVYRDEHGSAPKGSGVDFFAALIAEGTWEATDEDAGLLLCPGPGVAPDPADAPPPATRFAALPVSAALSSYAGRDQAAHPLAAFPTRGDEVLVACDNHAGMNHEGMFNALFADGSIVTYILEDEIARGTVPEGATTIAIGPDSPIEALRKLAAD